LDEPQIKVGLQSQSPTSTLHHTQFFLGAAEILSTENTLISSFVEHCSPLWTGSLASYLAQLKAMETKAFKINGISLDEAEYMGLSPRHRRQVSACYEVWTCWGICFSGWYVRIYVLVYSFRSEAMH